MNGYPRSIADVNRSMLIDEHHDETLSRGTARRHGLHIGDMRRPGRS